MNERDFRSLFARERARFARHYPRVAQTMLLISQEEHGTHYRDVAYSSTVGKKPAVVFVSRALRFDRGRLVAIVRHELAHCCNMRLSERDTDRLAERIGGEQIWYDRMDLQTVTPKRGAKRVRPEYLHQ